MYAWQNYPEFSLLNPLNLLKPKIEKVCTMEVKICPDETAVGRVPPNCEFAPCQSMNPATSPVVSASVQPQIPADWKIYKNEKYGYEISYPGNWYLSEVKEGPEKDKRVDFHPWRERSFD